MFDVQKEILDTHEARLTVKVTEEMRQQGMQKAARKISEEINIPGFRKGKAPYAIVLRHVGEQTLKQEAAQVILEEIYPQLIEQAQIEPYTSGELEDMEVDPLVYHIRVPLEPTIDLGDYTTLRQEWPEVTVTSEELQRSLEQIRERQAILEPVERPAQLGDQLLCEELHGWTEEGDEENEFLHEHQANVPLDESNPMISAEFIQSLVGMTKGEEKTFRLILPESMEEALRGREATINISVAEVYARALPELDDALASAVGPYETLEQLKAELNQRMLDYKQEQARDEYDQAIVEALVAIAQFHYPPVMLEEELDSLMEQLERRYKEDYRISLEDFARLQGKTMDQLRDELHPRAEQRLKQRLALRQLAAQEKIEIGNTDIDAEFRRFLRSLGMKEEEAAVQAMPQNQTEFIQELRGRAFGRKVLDRLEQIARGETPQA